MRGRRRRRALAVGAALVAAAGAGCAGTSAPRGWAPSAAEAGRDAYGAWIEIRGFGASAPEDVLARGELIAVGPAALWVLPQDSTRIRPVPRTEIASVRVTRQETSASALAVWTTVGTLSTISHGGFLVLTAPLWLIGGVSATVAEGRAATLESPPTTLASLAAFSRFPQGLPPGFQDAEVRPKPVRPEGASGNRSP